MNQRNNRELGIEQKNHDNITVTNINKNINRRLLNENDISHDSIDSKIFFYQVDKKFQLDYINPNKSKNINYSTNNKINSNINNNVINNENELFNFFDESIVNNKNLIISELDIEFIPPQATTQNNNIINYNINKDYKIEFERNIKQFLLKNKKEKKSIQTQRLINSQKKEKNKNKRALTDLISFEQRNIFRVKATNDRGKLFSNKTSKNNLNIKNIIKKKKIITSNQKNRLYLKNKFNINKSAMKILLTIPKKK